MSTISSIKRKANAFSITEIERRKKDKQFNIFHNKLRKIVNGVIKNWIDLQDLSVQKDLRHFLYDHTDNFVNCFEVSNHYKDAVNLLVEHYKKIKAEYGV